MAHHQIFDRLLEPLFNFGLKPFRCLSADRIADDDAIIGHNNNRDVEIVVEPVNIIGSLG